MRQLTFISSILTKVTRFFLVSSLINYLAIIQIILMLVFFFTAINNTLLPINFLSIIFLVWVVLFLHFLNFINYIIKTIINL
jgi:hypothetical protein